MIWRFTLLDRNNVATVIEEPVGWDKNVSEIKRDPDWHGIFFNNQGDTFEFDGKAMKLLYEENKQYGSEGNMFLIMEENCGMGFEEFSRGRFNFSKFENYQTYVQVPIENTSDVMDLRNRINQKVDLSTLKAFDETTDLEPYDKLPFDLLLPSKGIFMQDAASWETEETTTVNTQVVVWEGPTHVLPTRSAYMWFQILPQFDSIKFNEFGEFSPSAIPANDIFRAQWYSEGDQPEFTTVVNGKMGAGPDTRRIFFNWREATPLLVNDGNADNFDSIDKFSLEVNYSFDITIRPKYIDAFITDIVSLYNIVVIQRKNDTFEYLAKERIISGLAGGYDGYDPATIWKNGETHTVNFSRAFTDIKLNDGDYLFVAVVGLATSTIGMIGADYDIYDIVSRSGSVKMETLSHFAPTISKVFAVNEAISRIAESITNNKLKAYSEYFGRTDSQPYALPADGCGGLEVITDGIRVRRQENKVPDQTSIFSQSLQDVFNGLMPIHNIGMGVEPDPLRSGFSRLRVESWDFFYNDIVIMNCTGIDKITRKTYDKEIYSTFQFGYNKWEAEEYNGLDELLTKRNYRLTLSQIKNDLVKLSTWIGSGYALEVTRRKGNENTKDWRYDKEVFIICVRRGEVTDTIEVELGNVINAVNIIEPSTLYNFRISPVRNAMRWMSRVLESYKQFDAGSKIIFTDGDGNYFASGEMADGNCKLENKSIAENITIDPSIFIDSNAAKPFMAPERVIYDYPMSSKEYKVIEANPYGLIYFENDCDEGLGWIDTISYKPEEGLASFNLIPAIDIDPTGCVPVAIRGDGSLPAGLVNVPYSAIINLYGTGPFELTNIVKPGWMSIGVSGTTIYLSGTPTDVATSAVSFDVSNCERVNSASFAGSVNIFMNTCESVEITGTPSLPNGYTNTSYNYAITLSGDAPFVLSNVVKPLWMVVAIIANKIVFSGTPSEAGADIAVSFDVSNCSGSNTVSFSDALDITTLCIAASIIGTPDLPNALMGFAYNYGIDLAGTGPFTIDNIVAPDWMTVELSLNTVVFSGMPDVAGTDIDVSFDINNCAATPVSFADTINVIESGGGPDTNFANNDLTADADRVHDFAGHKLTIGGIDEFRINGEDSVETVPFVSRGSVPPQFLAAFDGANDGLGLPPEITSVQPTTNVILNVDGVDTGPIVFTRTDIGGGFLVYVASKQTGTTITCVSYTVNVAGQSKTFINASSKSFNHLTDAVLLLSDGGEVRRADSPPIFVKGEFTSNADAIEGGLNPGDGYNLPSSTADDNSIVAMVKAYFYVTMNHESGDIASDTFVYFDCAQVFTLNVDWGDGTAVDVLTGQTYYNAAHTYTTDGVFTAKFWVSDPRIIHAISIGNSGSVPLATGFKGLAAFPNVNNFGAVSSKIASFDPARALSPIINAFSMQGCLITDFNPTIPLPDSIQSIAISYNPLMTAMSMPVYPSQLETFGIQHCALTYLNPANLPTGAQFTQLFLNNNQLAVTNVNDILLYLDTLTPVSPLTIDLSGQTPAAAPTGAGSTAKASLIAKGNTIITD